ncbi:alanyl-tRNA editing protein [Candidatus Woesearchaeota archaeon]|nr:alanyl-tRNA editing protein [Candidatus Woesearchaeota archaeon]
MKQPKYLEDSYLQEYETGVKEANGKSVVLEDTIFYAQGGGQPTDKGTLIRTSDGQVFRVVMVRKGDGKITHEVDNEGLHAGETVACTLDWGRRYQLMRSHTAAHIISQVIHSATGAKMTGNQLETDKIRIDIDLPTFDKEKLGEYIAAANAVIDRNLVVSARTMSRAEVEANPHMVKLAMGLPPGIQELRILSIGDFDEQPDAGTHVKNTSEIGHLNLVKCENKGANNRRIYVMLE